MSLSRCMIVKSIKSIANAKMCLPTSHSKISGKVLRVISEAFGGLLSVLARRYPPTTFLGVWNTF